MKKWNLKTWQLITAAAILLTLILGMIVAAIRGKSSGAEPVEEYAYTVKEQVLADEVIVFLQNVGLGEAASVRTANEAVESYRLILQSNADVVNDNHTQAIQDRISGVLTEYVGKDDVLSEADIPALSAGVAEIVWRSILSQIESITENVEESDYFYLAESLQQQIRDLEERKMKVSIRADIKKNTDLTPEELLSMLEGMDDAQIDALAKSLGLSLDELYQLLENEGKERGAGDKELEDKLAELQKELEKELEEKLKKEFANTGAGTTSASNGTNGRDGRDGADGKSGQDGKAGNDGNDGKAGRDGDSIFIMYAETATGENMTETPTETTKYMGTYVGADASLNAADYTWTRYSDATISYSDGTLYITQ